jgi:signal transduction histidine kinase
MPIHLHTRKREALLLAATLLPIVGGCLVLAGWLFGIEALEAIVPGYATMKPVTALAFVLSGVSLWGYKVTPGGAPRPPWLGRLSAVAVLGLGLESSIESWFQVDFGFNQILFRSALLATHLPHPGRMSPATGWSFVLIGIALLLTDYDLRRRLRPSEFLALLVLLVGLLGLAGYIHGARGLYQSLPFTSVALHTTILFVVVGFGILLLRPERGIVSVVTSDQPGGWMARRLLPLIAGLPFFLAWLRTQGERAGLFSPDMGLAIFRVIDVAVLAVIVWMNARFLNRVGAERDLFDQKITQATRKLHRTNEELQAEIVRRQEAQKSLKQANESLEAKVAERTSKLLAANKELEAFSYSVSHDLRAPLRAIDGFSMLLLEKAGDKFDEEEKMFLDRVIAACRRMGGLIEDLLMLSRLTRSEMRRAPVNLSEMGRQIMDDLEKSQPGRRIEVSITPEMWVSGDEGLLRGVLENLLGNAWKFTGKKETARIDFGCEGEGSERVFFIRDNGAGFDMAYAQRLFGAFQRLHRTDEFEGNGIGLASVQRILHRHGGSIRAEAKVDGGATFFFTLPDPIFAGQDI